MNSILSLLPESGWQRLMCDALWQSTLIAGLGLLAARILVRQSAARAWLLLLTLVACAVVPLASLAARQSGWGLLAHAQGTSGMLPLSTPAVAWSPDHTTGSTEGLLGETEDAPPSDSLRAPDTHAISHPDFAPVEVQAPQAVESRSPDLATLRSTAPTATISLLGPWEILAAIWFLTSAILAMRLAVSAAATGRLLRRCQPCTDPSLLSAAAKAAGRVGLSKPPPILFSQSLETPTVFCVGRVRLLIPSAEQHANVNWTAAFTHELAHVARRDGWSRLLVELITIALPLQPIVWLARRAFRTACEEACDDWTIASGTNPIDFAETLTAWVHARHSPKTLAAIGMSSTKARTVRLLALHGMPKARVGRSWRLASISVVLSLVAGLAVAQTRKSEERGANPSTSSPDPQVKIFSIEKGDVNSLIAMLQKLFEGGTPPPHFAADPRTNSIIASGTANDLAVAEAILTKLETSDAHASADTTSTRPPAGSSVTGKAAIGTPPSEEAIQKLLSQDSLVILYARQLADRKKEWGMAKAEGKDEDKAWSDQCLAIQQKLDKRKSEIRPRIIEELTEEHSRSHPQQADASRQDHATSPTYVIEPPDILTLEAMQLVPKKPVRIAPFDKLKIAAENTLFDAPLSGTFQVDSEGEVVLGAAYGAVKLTGLTRREAEEAVTSKLEELLKEPRVALIIDESRLENGIKGDHLVGPDGTINLGAYGQAYVAGMTIPQAGKAIETQLDGCFTNPKVSLDVKSYNSKVYFVVHSGAGDGDNIQRCPFNGSETVLDAIAQVPGLTGLSKAHIWIARPTGAQEKTIQIDWQKALRGEDAANPQVLPGDRIFVTGATLLPGLPAGGSYRATPAWRGGGSTSDGSTANSDAGDARKLSVDPPRLGGQPADHPKIHAILLDSDEPNTWRWKLFIPKGNRYVWKLAYDDIPQFAPPVPRVGRYTTGISNEPYWDRDNEVLVTAKLHQGDDGKWRLQVDSKINSGTGKPTDQMSGATLEIPAEKLGWLQTASSTDGQLLASHGDEVINPKGPIILVQKRRCVEQLDGSIGPAPGPAPGFMIWLEKFPEQRPAAENLPRIDQGLPPEDPSSRSLEEKSKPPTFRTPEPVKESTRKSG